MTISLYEIDLSQLMGGEAFTVLCSLTHNGTYVDHISALPDSGANGFAFIDTDCAKDVMKFTGCKDTSLDRPIVAKGYDGVRGNPITHYLLIDLVIDGRRLVEIPFLVLDLGNHDIILGAKWMAYFDIQPDLRRRKLVWPDSLPQTSEKSFAKKIRVPRDSLKPQPIQQEHQLDVMRRQHAFDQDETRRVAGNNSGRISQILLNRPSQQVVDKETAQDTGDSRGSSEPATDILPILTAPDPQQTCGQSPDQRFNLAAAVENQSSILVCSGASYARQMAHDIAAMEASFQIAEIEALRDNQWYEDQRLAKQAEQLAERLRHERRKQALGFSPSYEENQPTAHKLDICEVSAAAFFLNTRRKDNELFSVSIYEIEYELSVRQAEDTDTDEDRDEVLAKLPKSYYPYIMGFSKAASNILPPHRPYDHRIELEADSTLGHGPLYSQSTEELAALKKYS